MASFPGAIKTFTSKTNKVDLVDAVHINDLQDEVNAIETELGTDPAGSVTDVKTRLYVCIDNDGAFRKGTSFPGSPIEGQAFYRTDEDIFYIYDDSTWDAINVGGIPTNIQVFTSSGTWTKPAGVSKVYVKVWGSGGGGQGGNSGSGYNAAGGGGGGYAEGLIVVSGNVTVTVDAGNAGGATGGLTGVSGSVTSFAGDTTIQATGGAGGFNNGGAGGVGSGGTINLTGTSGETRVVVNWGSPGGSAPLGSANVTQYANGVNGLDGAFPGGGGQGGAITASAGGAGAGGMVVVIY